MDGHSRAFCALAELLRYPKDGARAVGRDLLRAQACVADVGGALAALEQMQGEIAPLSDSGLEELYSRTFDINPAVSLDIGFHLFGLTYKRGEFLVSMQAELTRHGVSAGTELPDHLPVLLGLAAAMDAGERDAFVASCVAPAVRRMAAGFAENGAGYGRVLLALDAYLRASFECDDLSVPAPDEEYEEMEAPEASLLF